MTIINQNTGSIKACSLCTGALCCGALGPGKTIEAPFLASKDIETITKQTGLPTKEFSTNLLNPNTGNNTHVMKIINNSYCIFFNHQTNKCGIYDYRPIDCRLFPLDIKFIENKYWAVLIKYKYCNIQIDKNKCLSLLKNVVDYLGQELHDYATIPVPQMDKIGYQIIQEINFHAV